MNLSDLGPCQPRKNVFRNKIQHVFSKGITTFGPFLDDQNELFKVLLNILTLLGVLRGVSLIGMLKNSGFWVLS